MDVFSHGFVEILAAEQTPDNPHWFQGTADAVRQNLRHFTGKPYEYYLILSGDQLYRMDYQHLLHMDGDNYYIRDGVVVISRDAVIPSGTRI